MSDLNIETVDIKLPTPSLEEHQRRVNQRRINIMLTGLIASVGGILIAHYGGERREEARDRDQVAACAGLIVHDAQSVEGGIAGWSDGQLFDIAQSGVQSCANVMGVSLSPDQFFDTTQQVVEGIRPSTIG